MKTLRAPLAKQRLYRTAEIQDQTAQNVQSDL